MSTNEILSEVTKNKKYSSISQEFIKKVIQKNINKPDTVKQTRKDLHEVFIMYKNIRKEHEAQDILQFIAKNLPEEQNKEISILDLGCNEFPKFSTLAEKYLKIKSYTAIDISISPPSTFSRDVEYITEDLTNPKKDWQNKTYDLALLLNLIPVLEKIEKNSSINLLKKIKAISTYQLISFPLFSLSGKKYIAHYWKNWVKRNIDEKSIIASAEQNKEMLFLL